MLYYSGPESGPTNLFLESGHTWEFESVQEDPCIHNEMFDPSRVNRKRGTRPWRWKGSRRKRGC